jgi:hypothetical protein
MDDKNFIQAYCKIVPGEVWLNGEEYINIKSKPFVMNEFLNALYEKTGTDYRKFYKMDALSKLGFLASEILLAGIDRTQPKADMGIIFFNRSASLEADVNFQQTIQDKSNFFPSPSEFVYTLSNIVAGEIAIRNNICGETVSYVMRNYASDVFSQIIDNAMFTSGMKCVLAGWVEVDVFNNTLDCMMMLCTVGKRKDSLLHLPTGLKNMSEDKWSLNQFVLFDLYND